jgi:hypothetical protein
MRAEAQAHVDKIKAALALLRRFLDWDRALRRLDELNARVEDPTLWNDAKKAQEVMRERRRLDESISATRAIETELNDTAELIEMAEAEGDEDMAVEGTASLAALAQRAEKDKVMALLSGEADANDTYIEINSGAGGTESNDWAGMLQRMYTRWAERHGMKVELIDYHAGEQAGIKSATLLIKGENAYGYAKTESGVHRLVRISPYDSNARRHTSFARAANIRLSRARLASPVEAAPEPERVAAPAAGPPAGRRARAPRPPRPGRPARNQGRREEGRTEEAGRRQRLLATRGRYLLARVPIYPSSLRRREPGLRATSFLALDPRHRVPIKVLL